MDVGAVGGIGMGGAGAMGGAAAMGAAATGPAGTAPAEAAPAAGAEAANAAPTSGPNDLMNSINIRFLDGAFPFGLQQLAETMKDFSSAEILMALMILAAMEKDDKDKGGGSAALGLLAGLALAGQFGKSGEIQLNCPVEMSQGGGGVGMNLNVTG